jgi:hypothetical protein
VRCHDAEMLPERTLCLQKGWRIARGNIYVLDADVNTVTVNRAVRVKAGREPVFNVTTTMLRDTCSAGHPRSSWTVSGVCSRTMNRETCAGSRWRVSRETTTMVANDRGTVQAAG